MGFMKKKSTQMIVTVALAAGIILTGTFAWFSFTQSALNAMEGISNPGGNLHDDFEQGETNKDVYVENSGNRPIYVRVKMDEFMDVDGTSLLQGGVRGEMTTWNPHKYLGTSVENCGEPFHDHYQWIMGGAAEDQDGGYKFYMPAPFANQARFDKDGNVVKEPIAVTYENNNETMGDTDFVTMYGTSAAYDTLETGYEAYNRINALLYNTNADTGAVSDSQMLTDLKALYDTLDAATTASERRDAQTAIDTFLEKNSLGYWDKVYVVDDNGAINDGNTSTEGKDYTIQFVPLKRTLTTQKLYTMAQWIADGTPTGDFWILDNDGWAYWGNVLQPSASTGLLLSEVLLDENNKPAGKWYYGINVQLQAVTYDDIARFGMTTEQQGGGGITDQGMMVLQAASGNYAFDMATGKTGANDPVFTFVNNKDNTFRLMTSDGTNTITYGPLFVYTGSVPPATKGDIYHTGTNMGDSAYQIGQTFRKDIPFGNANTVFTVTDLNRDADGKYISGATADAGTAVLEGKDGKHYIKLTYTTNEVAQWVSNGGTNYPVYKKATAWLAVGADKQFNALTYGTATGTTGYLYSTGDDVLVWTEAAEPGMTEGADRFVEDASTSFKIGDTFTKDSHEWVIIGMDTKAGSSTVGQTLIVSKDVLEANVADGDLSNKLNAYGTSLTEIKAANGGTLTPKLLTVQDAMDYFADNAARVATTTGDNPVNAKWWLSDGIVGTNGALGTKDTSAADVGIRVAFWMDSEKLQTMLYPAPVNP